MTKSEIPNEPGDYLIEGIKIIVLPKKIMIETPTRPARGPASRDRDAYADREEGGENGGKKGGKKKGDWVNDMLDNAQDFLMNGGSSKRK